VVVRNYSFFIILFFLVSCSQKVCSSAPVLKKIESYLVENTSQGIISRDIKSVAIGKDKSIWVGTIRGYARFKDGRWTNYSYTVFKFCRVVSDGNGDVWILTDNKIINAENGDTLPHLNLKGYTYMNDLVRDKKGRIWVSTLGQGVFCFSKNVWRKYSTKDVLPSDSITDLHIDIKGRIWAGTSSGIAYFDREKWKHQNFNGDEKGQYIKSIASDKHGGLYVLTNLQQIWHYSNKKWRKYLELKQDYPKIDIILTNENDNTVLACGGGVMRIKGATVEKILSKFFISSAQIDDDTLWLGTTGSNCAGLIKYNLQTGELISYTPYGGLPANFVFDIYAKNKDSVFMGTAFGLACFDGQKWNNYGFEERTYGIECDRDNNIWFLSGSSLLGIKDGNIIRVQIPCRIYDAERINMMIDNSNNIWVANRNMSIKYDIAEDKFYKINEEFNLPTTNIRVIYVDKRKNVWLGTDNGLLSIKDGKTYTFNTENGLPGNRINAIEEDSRGRLWIGTARGLARFDGKRFTNSLVNKEIKIIKRGIQNDIWVADDRDLWWVNIDIYPADNAFFSFPSNYEINALDVDNEGNVWTGGIFDGVHKLVFEYKEHPKIEPAKISQDTTKQKKQIVGTGKRSPSEGEWPILFGNVQRTNAMPGSLVNPPFKLNWVGKYAEDNAYAVKLSPLLTKGMLLVTSYYGKITAFDAVSGMKLWQTVVNGPSLTLVYDYYIVVQGNDNNLNFLSLKNGEIIKEFNITLNDAIVRGDKIYGISNTGLYIIDGKNKSIKIHLSDVKGKFISSNNDYFIIASEHAIQSYSFDGNKKLWENKECLFPDYPILMYGDRLIALDDEGIYCFELMNGKILWQANLPSETFSPPAIWGNQVFLQYKITEKRLGLICFDLDNGSFLWKKEFDISGLFARVAHTFAPACANGIVYVSAPPHIYALETKSGRIIWQADAPDVSSPVIIGKERIYVSTTLTKIFAYKSSGEKYYTPEVIKKETIIDKDSLLWVIEEKFKIIKEKLSENAKKWVEEYNILVFKKRRNYEENIRCHQLMDSLASSNLADVVSLFIQKEALLSWTVGSTENFVETTLKNVLPNKPIFAKLLFPKLVEFVHQDYNETLKKKAILLMGYVAREEAVDTLKMLLNDYSVIYDVLQALCVQPHRKSSKVLESFLRDEKNNRYWGQAILLIKYYKPEETFKLILEQILNNEWADSLTKVYTQQAIEEIEKRSGLKSAEAPVTQLSVSPAVETPVESLDCAALEKFIIDLYNKKEYAKAYSYSLYGSKRYPESSILLYYKSLTAYNLGDIDVGIESAISLIERFPNFPCDDSFKQILEDALKKPRFKNKSEKILNYFRK